MTKQERLKKQQERLKEMKARETELHRQGYVNIAGVDEVGRGPLAGPVVAAAVVLPEDFDVLGIVYSKKLSEKRREELFDVILEKVVAWGIGMADHSTIDEINILQATKLAMKDAIADLSGKLEGIDYVIFDAVKINDLKLAFSRGGFHFHRPTYDNFLSSSRICGEWDYGYLHPANGICTVVGDEIWFFYSACSGESPLVGTHY